jgi:hypothetical protein
MAGRNTLEERGGQLEADFDSDSMNATPLIARGNRSFRRGGRGFSGLDELNELGSIARPQLPR